MLHKPSNEDIMLQFRRCLQCKHVFAIGDFSSEVLPKCPNCDSRLSIPTNNLGEK